MRAPELEGQIESFLSRLDDPTSDLPSLVEAIRTSYVERAQRNVLSSQATSRLYALAAFALFRRGSPESMRLIKTAIALAPYDQGYVRLYDVIAEVGRSQPAKPLALIMSCEKYAEKALRLAESIKGLERIDYRIVVGKGAAFPIEDRLLRVNAPDTYEGLPAKVSAAFVYAFEHYGAGTSILKIDDDVTVTGPGRLQSSLELMTRRGVQYSGRLLEGPDLDRIWHWGKCAAPEMNARVYGGRHDGNWAGGTAYFLGPHALRSFCLITLRFPDLLQGALYEDCHVAHVLKLAAIALRPAKLQDWGLALPGDVAAPAINTALWRRLDDVWRDYAAARPSALTSRGAAPAGATKKLSTGAELFPVPRDSG
jgi:hypothetical protein